MIVSLSINANVCYAVIIVGICLLVYPETCRRYSSASDVLEAVTSLCNRLSIAWIMLALAYVNKHKLEFSRSDDVAFVKIYSESLQFPFSFLGYAAFVTWAVGVEYTIIYVLANLSLPSADQQSTLHGYCIPSIHIFLVGIVFGSTEVREGSTEWPMILCCGDCIISYHSVRNCLALSSSILTGENGQYSDWSHFFAFETCVKYLVKGLSPSQLLMRAKNLHPFLDSWIAVLSSTVKGQAAGTLCEFLVKFIIVPLGISAHIWTTPYPRKLNLIAMVCTDEKYL